MPISSYKDLIDALRWDERKRKKIRWYLFLIMNPRMQTNAGIDIIKNFTYLDLRTGNVTFFLPGFSNMDFGIGPYCSENGREIVYQDDSFGELYFDEKGFLETISWLEDGCSSYRYSEDLDLVIVKYIPKYISEKSYYLYEQNFERQDMIVYNLDCLKKEGININRMITECMNVVSDSQSEWDVKQRLDNFIFSRIDNKQEIAHLSINVFVAGSKSLAAERDAVISTLSHVSNRSSRDYVFRVKTYEDFDRSLTNEGRQAEYNEYISREADYAIFILDGEVGGITFEEFKVAMSAYNDKKKPEIFVYSHMPNNPRGIRRFLGIPRQSEEVIAIRKHLSNINQYYIEYRDIHDLKNHIYEDFRRYSL